MWFSQSDSHGDSQGDNIMAIHLMWYSLGDSQSDPSPWNPCKLPGLSGFEHRLRELMISCMELNSAWLCLTLKLLVTADFSSAWYSIVNYAVTRPWYIDQHPSTSNVEYSVTKHYSLDTVIDCWCERFGLGWLLLGPHITPLLGRSANLSAIDDNKTFHRPNKHCLHHQDGLGQV